MTTPPDYDRRIDNQACISRRRGSPCGLCHRAGARAGRRIAADGRRRARQAQLRLQRRAHRLHYLQLPRRHQLGRGHAQGPSSGWAQRSGTDGRADPGVCRHGRRRRPRPQRRPAEQPAKPTDAQREAQLAKCRELRKMYNDAGVNIHLHKIGFGQSDEEIDFNFQVAKALGCVGITTERSETLAKRLAPFADKHKIWVAFHNHTNNYPVMDKTDPILAYGQYIGFNFDVGHYFAGTKGLSPIPVIEKYHDRILSLHLKDRTADGGNLPWGQGKTPIKEILQLMRKEKWTFPGDIELEYKIPQGSNAVAEVAKCVQYCKEALA